MSKWWKSGYKHAKTKNEDLMNDFRPDILEKDK